MSFWEKFVKAGKFTGRVIAKEAQKKQARSLEQMGMRLGGPDEEIKKNEAARVKLSTKQKENS